MNVELETDQGQEDFSADLPGWGPADVPVEVVDAVVRTAEAVRIAVRDWQYAVGIPPWTRLPKAEQQELRRTVLMKVEMLLVHLDRAGE